MACPPVPPPPPPPPPPLGTQVGLQNAMLLVPACYLISGVGLGVTEVVIKTEKEAERAARHAEQQLQQ